MSSRRLRRQIKLAIGLIIACTYTLLYIRVPVNVPVQYERWEQVARDTVRKTWAAKGVHEVLNSTLGVSAASSHQPVAETSLTCLSCG